MDSTIQNKPTETQFGNYQALFDYFNEKLFAGSLPEIILNFSRKTNAAGFFAPDRWSSQDGKIKTHEISINPSYMGTVTFERLCSTLVHEQAHLWQQTFGKPTRNGYHNKEWGDKMESIGLMPSDTGEEGGKRTGQRVTHYILENGQFKHAFANMPKKISLPWVAAVEGIPRKRSGKKKKTSKIKYTCPGCGMNVWGKPGLKVYCKPCETYLESEEPEDDSQDDD